MPPPRLREAPTPGCFWGSGFKEIRKWGYCSDLKYGKGCKTEKGRTASGAWTSRVHRRISDRVDVGARGTQDRRLGSGLAHVPSVRTTRAGRETQKPHRKCRGSPGHWALFEALEMALRSSSRVTVLSTKASRMDRATSQPHKLSYPTLPPSAVLHKPPPFLEASRQSTCAAWNPPTVLLERSNPAAHGLAWLCRVLFVRLVG